MWTNRKVLESIEICCFNILRIHMQQLQKHRWKWLKRVRTSNQSGSTGAMQDKSHSETGRLTWAVLYIHGSRFTHHNTWMLSIHFYPDPDDCGCCHNHMSNSYIRVFGHADLREYKLKCIECLSASSYNQAEQYQKVNSCKCPEDHWCKPVLELKNLWGQLLSAAHIYSALSCKCGV